MHNNDRQKSDRKVMLIDLLHENDRYLQNNRCTPDKDHTPETAPLPRLSEFDKTSSIISLEDPSTNIPRQYLLVADTNNADIFEIQCLKKTYSSFFVGSKVISNGDLFVSSRIDPLFFILNLEYRTQWEPLSQLLNDVPEPIKKALDDRQMSHLCETTDKFGDFLLYKFSVDKTVDWLRKKSNVAINAVKSKMMKEKKKLPPPPSLVGYVIPEDEGEQSQTTDGLTKTDEEEAKVAGLQIICNYLNDKWQKRLVDAMEMSPKDVLEESRDRGIKRPASWEARPGDEEARQMHEYITGTSGCDGSSDLDKGLSSNAKSKANGAKSAGLKRLEKVNTKGMKSLASFFGAAKKMKTK